MRKVTILFIIVALISSTSNVSGQTAADFTNVVLIEKSAGDETKEARNKQTALASFNAYLRGDIEGTFKDYDKDVVYYHTHHPESHKGLDTLKIGAKDSYERDKIEFPDRHIQIIAANADDDYVMLFFTDSATWKGDDGNWKATGKSYRINDVLILKFNDAGKIVEQRFILPFSEIRRQVNDGVEYDFNSAGYRLLGQKKYNDAIEVFKFNVKMYPQSANTYDSLAEAYARAGNKKLAIKNYEKAVELDPKNENAKEIIAKLKAGETFPAN